MASTIRSGYSAGKFSLELDGRFAGFLSSVEGGEVYGEVVEENPGEDGVIRKHLGDPRFEPIRITFGTGMSEDLYDWVSEAFVRAPSRHDGAIVFCDYQLNVKERLEWTGGLITEVVLPPLDASSKDTGSITVTITPELTRTSRPSGKTSIRAGIAKQKKWLAANFNFSLTGLETASRRVRKIDSICMTFKPIPNVGAGVERIPLDAEGKRTFSNVRITVPLADAEPYQQWAEDFIVNGNNAQDRERSGSIDLLDPSMKTPLFSLTLGNVGIVRARMQRAESSSEVVALLDVQLYCETMVFKQGPDVVAKAEPPAAAAPNGNAPNGLPTDALLALLLERDDVQTSIENVVRADGLGTANSDLRAKLVAARLQSRSAAPVSEPTPRREDGVAIGARWATESASISELEQVAQLNEAEDWTALGFRVKIR